MNTPMTLDEYKKKVEDLFRKENPQYTNEEIKRWMTIPENVWQRYMEDFSPEVLSRTLDSGLI